MMDSDDASDLVNFAVLATSPPPGLFGCLVWFAAIAVLGFVLAVVVSGNETACDDLCGGPSRLMDSDCWCVAADGSIRLAPDVSP